MKRTIKAAVFAGLAGLALSPVQANAKSGEDLFRANCLSCHVTAHPEDESKLSAPPIMGAVRHVKMNYDTRQSAVAFIVDYVQNPSKDKATCAAHTIEKFGVMPSLKGNVSPEDLTKIAEYLYDTYPHGHGGGHGKERHQGQGCQSNHGQGHGHGKGYGRHGQGKGRGGGQ